LSMGFERNTKKWFLKWVYINYAVLMTKLRTC